MVSASAPDIGVLIAVGLVVGAGSVAAQILVPMAASLADEEHRGHVVGVVMSGLLLGILLARTVSGIVAQASSWRVVYVMAAGMTAVLAVVLARRLPGEGARPRIGYGTLLRTAARLLVTEPVLRRRAFFGALGLRRLQRLLDHHGLPAVRRPLPLRRPDHRAVRAGGGGRRPDAPTSPAGGPTGAGPGPPPWSSPAWWPLSFLPLWWGRHNLAMLIVGILLLDVGVQGLQVTNQSLIYRLAPDARSRINSAYMVCYFAGGAIGSAVGSSVYETHRWAGVCVLGAGIGIVATVAAVVDGLPPAAVPRRHRPPSARGRARSAGPARRPARRRAGPP